jgi:lipopolysaccharide export system ATP-binding protein
MSTRRGQPYRSNRRQRRARVDELLDQFGLTRLRKSIAATLSGGERRRLEIARCLLSEPMLIMLDEPFTGIDPKTVSDIQKIVRDLRHDGIGVLITDHHVAETLRITDRSYLIADGQMLTHGTPLEIINDPNARRVYLGDAFSTASIGEELAQPKNEKIRSLLESERIFEWISELAGDRNAQASDRLRLRGGAAIEPLIQALDRNDPIIRARAFETLRTIVGVDVPFDPHTDQLTRMRQIQAIRKRLTPRDAG